jgi:hypothetical protein
MPLRESMQGRGWVAAFGKHPGWDDHIDDIGLVTPELVAFKRLLYFEGVGTNIDSGRWESLSAAQRLPGFGHAFLVCGGGRVLVGRLWASKDRQGRSLYPMVVCAQTEDCAVAPAVTLAMPLLIELQELCQRTEGAATVQAAVAAIESRLTAAVADRTAAHAGVPSDMRSGETLARWAETIPPAADNLGLQRLCHRFARDLVGFRQATALRDDALSSQHMRVPAGEGCEMRSLLLWVALLRRYLSDAVPLFLLRPFGQEWIDVLVGAPQARQFACLLSGREAIPWVTEIPYTLDPDAHERSVALIGLLRSEAESAMQALWQVPTQERPRTLSGWWQRVQELVR